MIELARGLDSELSRFTSDELVRIFEAVIEDVMLPGVNTLREKLSDSLRIACFSERLNSPPMWAHYADGHRGMCLEYDVKAIAQAGPHGHSLYPVIYSPHVIDWTPYFTIAMQDRSKLNPYVSLGAALYKNTDWSYEREWRLVVIAADPPFEAQIPKPSAILMGLRASEASRDELARLAAELDIPLGRMMRGRNALEVEIAQSPRIGPA